MSDTEIVTENGVQRSDLNGGVEDKSDNLNDLRDELSESNEVDLNTFNLAVSYVSENGSGDNETNKFSMDNGSISKSKENILSSDVLKEPKELDYCIDKDDSSENQKSNDDKWIFILGHDELKKRVLKVGDEGGVRGSKGQVAEVKCSGRLEDGTRVDGLESLKITLGEEEFIPAFDLCIPLMYVGEVCELVSKPRFAYGKHGRRPDIPSDSTITYEIELLSIVDATPYSELPLKEKIQLSNKKRVRGNDFYEKCEYSRSLTEYMRALKVIESEGNPSEGSTNDDLEELLDMKVKCYNNLAAAQMKIEAWDAAQMSCDEVLKFQPDNVKAMFRKGKCKTHMSDTKGALSILKEAAKLSKNNKVVLNEVAALEEKLRKEDDSEKKLYQKMLGMNNGKQEIKKKIHKNSDWWKLYIAGAVVAAITSVGFIVLRYSGE